MAGFTDLQSAVDHVAWEWERGPQNFFLPSKVRERIVYEASPSPSVAQAVTAMACARQITSVDELYRVLGIAPSNNPGENMQRLFRQYRTYSA